MGASKPADEAVPRHVRRLRNVLAEQPQQSAQRVAAVKNRFRCMRSIEREGRKTQHRSDKHDRSQRETSKATTRQNHEYVAQRGPVQHRHHKKQRRETQESKQQKNLRRLNYVPWTDHALVTASFDSL